MAESGIRARSNAAKGKPPPAADKPSLQVTLLGQQVVLDILSLTIGEKQTWRGYCADLGDFPDEADHMLALAVVLIQRTDPALTWAETKDRVTWKMMLDAIAAGRPAEADHPQS